MPQRKTELEARNKQLEKILIDQSFGLVQEENSYAGILPPHTIPPDFAPPNDRSSALSRALIQHIGALVGRRARRA
jgi:hypothetical protein